MAVQDQGFELDGVLEFGERGDVIVTEFTPGSSSLRAQLAPNPRGDNIWPGRDRKTPGTWGWSLAINRTNEAEAYETLGRLQEVWDAEQVRLTPGAVSTLRYSLAGRVRRIYGRPRRCELVPPDIRRFAGVLLVEADFERVDTLHYDDVEQSATLTVVPAAAGGLTEATLIDPLTSLMSPEVARSGQIVVTGPSATPAIVRFTGATGASDLRIVVDDQWSAGIKGAIGANETITVDARPWVRSATLASGGSAASRIDPATRFEAMTLSPGAHEIRLEGSDPTGTAQVTVLWRPASKSL